MNHGLRLLYSDPGFGSSAFGVCITELVDGMINVVYADESPSPDFNQMISTTVRLLDEYDITFKGRSRIFVDGASPSFLRSLKERVDEDTNYEQQIAFYKHNILLCIICSFYKEHVCYSSPLCKVSQGDASTL